MFASVLTVVLGVLIVAVVVIGILLAITPLLDARRQRLLRECLLDMCAVLNTHGVDYWCDFGTLLGYYRDHDVIRTDYDVDLCVFESERSKLIGLVSAFKARGYTLNDSNGTTKLVIRIVNDRTNYFADAYVYRPDGPIARSTFRSVEDVPMALVADRVNVDFLGGSIRIPRDVEPLLLHRYGPGYKVPRRGDQGLAYGYSRVEMIIRMVENNWLGLWSIIRQPFV